MPNKEILECLNEALSDRRSQTALYTVLDSLIGLQEKALLTTPVDQERELVYARARIDGARKLAGDLRRLLTEKKQ